MSAMSARKPGTGFTVILIMTSQSSALIRYSLITNGGVRGCPPLLATAPVNRHVGSNQVHPQAYYHSKMNSKRIRLVPLPWLPAEKFCNGGAIAKHFLCSEYCSMIRSRPNIYYFKNCGNFLERYEI